MAKVLFVNPVIREEDDPKHVPYGMALLASIIMREGRLLTWNENGRAYTIGAHGELQPYEIS